MPIELANYEKEARKAVKAFWTSRKDASERQAASGRIDQGTRGAVTGGNNMNGFENLMRKLVIANGLQKAQIIHNRQLVTLPGFFRPTKKWDFLVINQNRLIAALEFKSQVGSFGNNFNNRTEEAIGTAHDFWVAYREGAFGDQQKPFLGWLMLVEDRDKSRTPVKDKSPYFPVFPEFGGASYAERYNLLCKKMVKEQLYTSACILTSPETGLKTGEFSEMDSLTGLKMFATTFAAHIAAEAART